MAPRMTAAAPADSPPVGSPAGDATGTPTADALALRLRILADQVSALQRTLPSILVGNTLVPLVVVVALWGTVARPWLLGWLALQWLHSAFNAWAWWRTRRRPAKPHNATARARATVWASGISGLLWGLSVPLLWPEGRFDLQGLLIFLIGGMASAAMHALAALLPAFHAFLWPAVAGVVGTSLWAGTAPNLVIGTTVLIYGITSTRFAGSLNRTLTDSLRNRYQVAALAADLQVQKERAEAASLDKSRFLAAASHDLRQPVHALALFLGALRRQPLTAEGARLAGHAADAVDTMGGLFNALLDVSRLDAGMVQPEVRAVPLTQLLQRVADQARHSASSAGLRLQLRLPPGAGPWVETDPVLLERVLANLVSNAIRYTERGTVLVALRHGYGGPRVQVRDSGIGIPADSQERVFQEFVQLHNPERDRHKGLGLGLAIVRRTAGLLGLPLALRSAPGQGSCFTLGPLPALRVPVAVPAPAPAVAAAPLPLAGLRVVVIDDDPQILAAMDALLGGWGCQVHAAADVAALRPLLLAGTAVPDLLISDFRLRAGASGLDAVAHLRDEFNEDIPAILITGDTAPERLREAQASQLLLLHKPVHADALRQAITTALAWRPAPTTPVAPGAPDGPAAAMPAPRQAIGA
jgi:signal transduction histidine kinase